MGYKNKNMLQGMEHLKGQLDDSEVLDPALQDDETTGVLKKELITIFLIMSVLFLVLVGLMVFDKSGSGLDSIAEHIVSFVTN